MPVKLEWRGARQVMAGGMLVAGLSVGTGVAHVGASSQPTASRTIPRSGHVHESHGEFFGHPGETITVGANGVINVRRGTGTVTVKPDKGYVLARFNPKAGRFEGVKGASFHERPAHQRHFRREDGARRPHHELHNTQQDAGGLPTPDGQRAGQRVVARHGFLRGGTQVHADLQGLGG